MTNENITGELLKQTLNIQTDTVSELSTLKTHITTAVSDLKKLTEMGLMNKNDSDKIIEILNSIQSNLLKRKEFDNLISDVQQLLLIIKRIDASLERKFDINNPTLRKEDFSDEIYKSLMSNITEKDLELITNKIIKSYNIIESMSGEISSIKTKFKIWVSTIIAITTIINITIPILKLLEIIP